MPDEPSRYSRQSLVQTIGTAGQAALADSRVVVIGCGALGTHLADALVRGGVGFVRIVDRDYVELSNLQRQILFDEADAAEGMPKAVAAARRLASINSTVVVEPVVADVTPANIETFVTDTRLILDATDNFEIRFLINDAAVRHNMPWVYGACVGVSGMVMTIIPGATPCLRCVWDEPPPPGMNPTCDTAGILAPAASIVAAMQTVAALKVLTGKLDAVTPRLMQFDVWGGQFDSFDCGSPGAGGSCRCCVQRKFDHLEVGHAGRTATLCGRDAVQIPAAVGVRLDFGRIADAVRPVAKSPPTWNRYLLRFEVDACQITVFADGRAIIKGTHSPEVARTLYARYIGT